MSGRMMVEGLRHPWAATEEDFFRRIDEVAGGWPAGFLYVGFSHTDEREAGFTNSPNNDGWWTVVASADDYHLWKLSPEALQRIASSVIASARISPVNVENLFIRNSFGGRAIVSKAAK